MGDELESIAQITSTGDLRTKLIEAEAAKVDVEAHLLKCVRFIYLFLAPIQMLKYFAYTFFLFFGIAILEYSVTRNVRRMGTM